VAPFAYQQPHILMPTALQPQPCAHSHVAMQQGVGVVAPSVISPQCAYTPSEYQTDRTPPARKVTDPRPVEHGCGQIPIKDVGGVCFVARYRHAQVSSGAPRSSVGSPRVQVKVPWTHEEDLKVLDGVSRYGQSWAKIARDLPESRTDDAVRNRWHRLMSKQRRHEILVAVSNGGEGVDEELCDSDSNRPPKKRRGAKVSMSAPKPRSRTENNCEAVSGIRLNQGQQLVNSCACRIVRSRLVAGGRRVFRRRQQERRYVDPGGGQYH